MAGRTSSGTGCLASGRRARFVLLALLALPLTLPAQGPAGPQQTPQPFIQYSRTSAQPVIEYTLVHSLLVNNDPVPLLRVYGDGRVVVHRPVYMKNAGDFKMQLSPAELDGLLQSLAADGIMDFDAATARQERQQLVAQQRASTGMLYEVSDSTDTLITVRLASFRSTPAAPLQNNLQQQLRWDNLDLDARRFPASNRLVRAATGAQRLHDLTRHPALRRLP